MGITPSSTFIGLQSGVLKSWVCIHQAKVVGFCTGEMRSGEVLVLAVLPDYEGLGIGKTLLQHVVDELRAAKPQRIWLTASPDPTIRAHGFYRSQGWKNSGEVNEIKDEVLVLPSPSYISTQVQAHPPFAE